MGSHHLGSSQNNYLMIPSWVVWNGSDATGAGDGSIICIFLIGLENHFVKTVLKLASHHGIRTIVKEHNLTSRKYFVHTDRSCLWKSPISLATAWPIHLCLKIIVPDAATLSNTLAPKKPREFTTVQVDFIYLKLKTESLHLMSSPRQ